MANAYNDAAERVPMLVVVLAPRTVTWDFSTSSSSIPTPPASTPIASAVISQCLTRYSCSWIAALPPQVVSRQSPETDYVSGATQSTNAFYYAVVEALAKAK